MPLSPVVPPTVVPGGAPLSGHGAGILALAVLDEDGELELGPGAAELADDLGVDLLALAEPLHPGTRAGDLTTLSAAGFLVHLIGVGAGRPDDLRRAGAALAGATRGVEVVASSVQAIADDAGLAAFVTGVVLGSFRYTLRGGGGGGGDDDDQRPVGCVLLAGGPVDAAVLDRALGIARASWEARRLATVPSNIKSPEWLAGEIVRLGESAGLKVRVWDEGQLETEGFGGIVAVGRASATPPRLVQLEYVPSRRRRRTPHVVLVGKGITFDTGGLSIKPGEAMVNMKRDMTGAGVVAATMSALRLVDSPVRVTGLMAIAENAVGGAALRPGDVIRHWGGRTTEVTNTDAEGRLVMADALQYAVTKLRPDLVVDIATLTGAVKVALGLNVGGYFATDDAVAALVEEASVASGERIWRLPLAAEYEPLLASAVADSDNAPGGPGAVTAALFLQHFTGGLPWAHFDIASVGDSLRDNFEYTKGPTGFGVRLLLHWLGSPEPLEGVVR